MRIMRFSTWFLACALVAGCAGPKLKTSADVTAVAGDTLPTPGRDDLTSQSRPYFVGPFDELEIDVFGIEELNNRKVQVDASGRISFPLIGVLEVAGKTPVEISNTIETGLRSKYIRDPQVTVNLTKTVSQVVTVEGEVREPGLYPVVGRMSLMRAVATAKGTTEYSQLDDVVVFRTVKGQRYAALYSLKAIRKGVYADPEIYANDVVTVGDSRARRLFRDFLSLLPLLTTPIIVALQN